MSRHQEKKGIYYEECFCEECEKEVEIEVNYIVLDSSGMKGKKCTGIMCSQRSKFPYSCVGERLENCVIVQEIIQKIEDSTGNF